MGKRLFHVALILIIGCFISSFGEIGQRGEASQRSLSSHGSFRSETGTHSLLQFLCADDAKGITVAWRNRNSSQSVHSACNSCFCLFTDEAKKALIADDEDTALPATHEAFFSSLLQLLLFPKHSFW